MRFLCHSTAFLYRPTSATAQMLFKLHYRPEPDDAEDAILILHLECLQLRPFGLLVLLSVPAVLTNPALLRYCQYECKAIPIPNPNPISNRNNNVTVSLTLSQPNAKPDACAKKPLAVVHNYCSTKTTHLQAEHKYTTKANLCIRVQMSDHSFFGITYKIYDKLDKMATTTTIKQK